MTQLLHLCILFSVNSSPPDNLANRLEIRRVSGIFITIMCVYKFIELLK